MRCIRLTGRGSVDGAAAWILREFEAVPLLPREPSNEEGLLWQS